MGARPTKGRKRTPEQVIHKLRQAQVEVSPGAMVGQVCKKRAARTGVQRAMAAQSRETGRRVGTGSHRVGEIEHAPLYLRRVGEGSVEFGFMPRDFPGESAGRVYIKLYGPPYVTVLWSTLDCEP